MGKLEKWTLEFYTAIAGYKWDDLDWYINAILDHWDAIDNSEAQHKIELDNDIKQACPTDPFLRVMCEWCQ